MARSDPVIIALEKNPRNRDNWTGRVTIFVITSPPGLISKPRPTPRFNLRVTRAKVIHPRIFHPRCSLRTTAVRDGRPFALAVDTFELPVPYPFQPSIYVHLILKREKDPP